MAETKNKKSSRLVGITGGGGLGTILIQMAGMINDPTMKNIYLSAVPFFSLLLGGIFTFIAETCSLDANYIRKRIELKFTKWVLRRGIKTAPTDDLRSLAEQRYNIILGIEIGVYNIDDYLKTATPPPIVISSPSDNSPPTQ
ncbi:hypothetical protein PSI23_21005 [Xenorhabdus sp. XENO-10]|uniref:Uncharacterized protein n=1 Tax=Xenorhabdus yunnanensis TaxID=3025878 RepID=A0ABT5LPF5_9GAMM|nr:hypothetical protein [Xenorhabdus yunnanensis]MDC9591689.1 hypothetical protein [Xenorhabdus yunnanensis]